MKSLLVPAGGSDSDIPVFETALAAARPVVGHLHFLHVHVGAGQAAVHIPHAAFARGSALVQVLETLEARGAARSAAAGAHVRDFCARAGIEMRDLPGRSDAVTASWQAGEGGAARRIIQEARYHDLIVVARPSKPNGLPRDFLELLLVGCGRPLLIPGPTAPRTVAGTIMVAWRETPEAARAVAAAMPLLVAAQRVVVVNVAEEAADATTDAVSGVVRHLAWNGATATARVVAPDGRATSAILAAVAAECEADLVVLGAYGHSRMRELLFGGCTQSFIDHADRAVLLMH